MENKKEDLISVIVPVYNVEMYLGECIESICSQTYNNLEILLIDDGSTDHSGSIADHYAQTDKRIKVLHKQNEGLSSARNAGLDFMSGEYLCFIDSDDIIADDFIEVLYQMIKKYKADIAQCDFYHAVQSENFFRCSMNEREHVEVFSGIEMQCAMFDRKKEVAAVISCNKLYCRWLFAEIRFPENRLHEDEATTYRVYDLADKIAVTDKKKYFYRKREGSIVSAANKKRAFDLKKNFEEKLAFYKKEDRKKLYALTLKRYCYKIKDCLYFEPENKDLKEEMSRCKKIVLCSRDIGWKEKIRLFFL